MVYVYSEENVMPPLELDHIDQQILEALHENSRISYTEVLDRFR